MKKKIVTYCLGIGMDMFTPVFLEHWVNPVKLVVNNLKSKRNGN